MVKLSHKTIAATVGNFSTTIALAVAILTLTNFGSAETVGHFSFGLAVAAPIFLLLQLRLRDVVATDVLSPNWSRYRQLSITMNVIGGLIAGPIAWLVGLDTPTVIATQLIGCWKATVGVSDVVYGWHQREGRLDFVARLQVSHSVATSVVFLTVFGTTRSLPATLASVFVANLLLLTVVDLRTIKAATPKVENSRGIWSLFGRNLPLGMAGAIFSLNMILPRQQLESSFSMVEVGIFSAIAFLARAGTPMMQAFGQASTHQLNQCVLQQDGRSFMATLGRAIALPMVVGLALVVGFWLKGEALVGLIYGEKYATDPTAFVLVMLYACFVYLATVLTYGIIAAGRLKSQLMILSGSVLITYLIGDTLIAQQGVRGACWAILGGGAFRLTTTLGVIFWIGWTMTSKEKLAFSPPDIR